MFCHECESDDGLVEVIIIDVFEDEPVIRQNFCKNCLRKKGFFCEEHGPHLLVHMDEFEGEEGAYLVTDICFECTKGKILELPQTERRAKATLLRRALPPSALETVVSFGIPPEIRDPDVKLLFDFAVTCILFKRTFEEGLADLIKEETGNPQ